jgi:putative peptidoglycan lipid II flippase
MSDSDSTKTIFHTAQRFFSGTMLSRVFGMLRDMAMAFAFGTQGPVAAFMLAFRFSHLLRRLFGEGALQSAFVPEFEALRHKNPQKAFSFFRDLYAVLTLFLLVLVIIGGGILGAILAYGDLHPDNQQIILLTLLMLPSLLFICLYGLNASILQCEKKYFVSSAAPAAFNAVLIVCALLLKDQAIDRAMIWLAGGVIISCFAQWFMTIPGTWKIFRQNLSEQSWSAVSLWTPELKVFCSSLSLGILGVAATQVNSAVDSIFARYAESEGPAFLWYAMRIQQLPLALFGVAVSSALLPPLARAIKQDDVANYHYFLSYALSKTFMLMLPITVAVLLMGDVIINLMYGRGDFDQASVAYTTRCLWGYSVGLLPTALILLLAPAFYARSDYLFPTWGAILCMLSNCLLNTWFIMGLGWGSASVAWATSISAWGNLCFLGWGLVKRQGSMQNILSKPRQMEMAKVSLACLIAGVVFYSWRVYFLQDPALNQLAVGGVADLTRAFTSQLISFTGQAAIFCVIIVASGYICRVNMTDGY